MKFFTLLLLLMTVAYSLSATVKSADEIKKYEQQLRDSVNGVPMEPEESQPAWETSGKFEGDILLTEDQIKMLVDEYSGTKNAVTNKMALWPNNEVIYDIDTKIFTPDQVEVIKNATDYISSVSCISFRQKTDNDKNYVHVQDGIGCYSIIGYTGNGVQHVKLEPAKPGSGCFVRGVIVHEFLHTLGFFHMHSTYSRDKYVKILWDNIIEDQKFNFEKHTPDEVTLLGTKYDYGSILHYSNKSFAIDKTKYTIVPIKKLTSPIGQREKMTDSDIVRLNRLYNCPGY